MAIPESHKTLDGQKAKARLRGPMSALRWWLPLLLFHSLTVEWAPGTLAKRVRESDFECSTTVNMRTISLKGMAQGKKKSGTYSEPKEDKHNRHGKKHKHYSMDCYAAPNESKKVKKCIERALKSVETDDCGDGVVSMHAGYKHRTGGDHKLRETVCELMEESAFDVYDDTKVVVYGKEVHDPDDYVEAVDCLPDSDESGGK